MSQENPTVERNGFLRVPSVKTLVSWFALLGAALTVGGFVFLRSGIYEVDQKAQAVVNAQVSQAQVAVKGEINVVVVRLDALVSRVEEVRAEQRAAETAMGTKLDTLLRRRP